MQRLIIILSHVYVMPQPDELLDGGADEEHHCLVACVKVFSFEEERGESCSIQSCDVIKKKCSSRVIYTFI